MLDCLTYQGKEYPLVLDVHTHTIVSGHAYGTIREMAQAASEKGLALLGISEHGPGIPGTCETIYFTNMDKVPRVLSGVPLIMGCEMNVTDQGTLSLPEFARKRLDYGIVGIHCLCYHDAGIKKNTENLIACMKDHKVNIVSHPDDDHTPLDYPTLVAAAKQYQVALEVNNSSFYKPQSRINCVENYRTMLKLCEQTNTPIIIDSDAHDPSWVGNFTKAIALLNEVQFNPQLVLNTSVEKFKSFIAAK